MVTLGKIGGSEAVERLIRILEDEYDDEKLRYEAALALAETGDESAFDVLIRARRNKTRYTRSGAAFALGRWRQRSERK